MSHLHSKDCGLESIYHLISLVVWIFIMAETFKIFLHISIFSYY